jgi:hypothetical protein
MRFGAIEFAKQAGAGNLMQAIPYPHRARA